MADRQLMLARYWAARKTSKVRFQSGNAGFRLLMLTSKNDLLTAQVSLASLNRHAREMPEIVIACDSTLSIPEAKTALGVTDENIRFLTIELVAGFFERTGFPALASLCRRHVFGYKLAASLMQSLDSRVLYADSDILWHSDPSGLMNGYMALPLYASQDYQASYDQNLFEILPTRFWEALSNSPFINAGFIIYNRPLADNKFLLEILESVSADFKMEHFTEQTFVAMMVKSFGGFISKSDVETVQLDPKLLRKYQSDSERPKYASHFVSPVRRYFWHVANQIF